MKKSLFFLWIVAFILLNVNALGLDGETEKAKEVSEKSFNVFTNPLSVLTSSGAIEAAFDFKISENWALGVMGGYIPYAPQWNATGGTDPSDLNAHISGYLIGAAATWYITGKAISTSWYLRPTFVFDSINVKWSGGTGTSKGVTLGALAGHQWVLDCGINFALGLGPAYSTARRKLLLDNGASFNFVSSGSRDAFWILIGQASIGYAF